MASQFLYFCITGFPRGPTSFTSHTSECYSKTGSLGSRSLPNASPAWEGLQVPRRPSDASRCEVRPAARAQGRDWRALGPSKGHSNATVPGFYSRGGRAWQGAAASLGTMEKAGGARAVPASATPVSRPWPPRHTQTRRQTLSTAAGRLPAEPLGVWCKEHPLTCLPKTFAMSPDAPPPPPASFSLAVLPTVCLSGSFSFLFLSVSFLFSFFGLLLPLNVSAACLLLSVLLSCPSERGSFSPYGGFHHPPACLSPLSPSSLTHARTHVHTQILPEAAGRCLRLGTRGQGPCAGTAGGGEPLLPDPVPSTVPQAASPGSLAAGLGPAACS